VGGLYWVRAGMDKGFKKVILESDSVVVINLIIKNNATMDRNYNFIMQIRRLLDRDWEVQTTHVYREANSAADWLANYGLTRDTLDRKFDILEEPPSELYSILYYDLIESFFFFPFNLVYPEYHPKKKTVSIAAGFHCLFKFVNLPCP
jgi:hypothetical protein